MWEEEGVREEERKGVDKGGGEKLERGGEIREREKVERRGE